MARPSVQGLEYFSLDCNFDEDDKIAHIEVRHGDAGCGILMKLLAKIYSVGYWYRWTEDEELLFVKRISSGLDLLRAVVAEALKRGLFNQELYEKHQILTSAAIQNRFFKAVEKRNGVRVVPEFLLVQPGSKVKIVIADKTGDYCPLPGSFRSGNSAAAGVSAELTPVNSELTTQRKGKESKGGVEIVSAAETPGADPSQPENTNIEKPPTERFPLLPTDAEQILKEYCDGDPEYLAHNIKKARATLDVKSATNMNPRQFAGYLRKWIDRERNEYGRHPKSRRATPKIDLETAVSRVKHAVRSYLDDERAALKWLPKQVATAVAAVGWAKFGDPDPGVSRAAFTRFREVYAA